MNQHKLLKIIIGVGMILLLSIGCGTPAQSPAPLTPTSMPLPPESPPTQIPTREPTLPILPTATIPPLVPTSNAARVQGGLIVAAGTSQLIVYGQRAGTSGDGIHVVNAETFDEVKTQDKIQLTLNGGGPPLFAFLGPQQFTNNTGETALANVSVGSTEDPNVSIGVLWTGEIDGTLPPAEPLSAKDEIFSVQSGTSAEEEGWLELGKIWTSDSTLGTQDQQEGFSFFLFHHGEEVFILGFYPNYQFALPAEDLNAAAPTAHSGQDYLYLVKGSTGGTVYIPQQAMIAMPLPIFQVNYIERIQ